jgi:hypothetical protein
MSQKQAEKQRLRLKIRSLIDSFIRSFKQKQNVMPDFIVYFINCLPQTKQNNERRLYVFTKWLAKIMCKEMGDYCLS